MSKFKRASMAALVAGLSVALGACASDTSSASYSAPPTGSSQMLASDPLGSALYGPDFDAAAAKRALRARNATAGPSSAVSYGE